MASNSIKLSIKMPWVFRVRFQIMIALIRAYVRVVKPTDEERELIEHAVGKSTRRLVEENVEVKHR